MKALGKSSPWLVWQQSTREALRGTIQWYQEVSHVLFLILFSFFVLPDETDSQLSTLPPPNSTNSLVAASSGQ